MAILNPMYSEREDLRMRMDRARSRDEYEYFRDRLHEVERRDMMRHRDMMDFRDMTRIMPTPPPLTLAPEQPNALTFLEKADKKLLLTGAPT